VNRRLPTSADGLGCHLTGTFVSKVLDHGTIARSEMSHWPVKTSCSRSYQSSHRGFLSSRFAGTKRNQMQASAPHVLVFCHMKPHASRHIHRYVFGAEGLHTDHQSLQRRRQCGRQGWVYQDHI